jgi:hypothetical protein
VRNCKTKISFFGRRTEKEQFIDSDKRIMALNSPNEKGLKIVFINEVGKRITFPIKELLNSWLLIDDYKFFYVSREKRGLTCEVEFKISD